jgi:hypothetical protein
MTKMTQPGGEPMKTLCDGITEVYETLWMKAQGINFKVLYAIQNGRVVQAVTLDAKGVIEHCFDSRMEAR